MDSTINLLVDSTIKNCCFFISGPDEKKRSVLIMCLYVLMMSKVCADDERHVCADDVD